MRLCGRLVANITRQSIPVGEKEPRALGEVESFRRSRRHLRIQFSHSGEYNSQRILRSLCFLAYSNLLIRLRYMAGTALSLWSAVTLSSGKRRRVHLW